MVSYMYILMMLHVILRFAVIKTDTYVFVAVLFHETYDDLYLKYINKYSFSYIEQTYKNNIRSFWNIATIVKKQ